MSEKKIFIVETISQHRLLYAVKAESREEAETFVLSADYEELKEMGQDYVGESVFCSYDVDEEGYIETFDDINDYLKDWQSENKLKYINDIKSK